MLIFRRILSVAPCGLTALALIAPSTPMIARCAIAIVFLVTLIDSAAGLLLVAAVGPLGSYLAALFGFGTFRLTEAMLLAFVAAWLVQPLSESDGPRLPRYATIAGWLFAVLVISLTAGVVSQLLRYPDALRSTLLSLAESYFDRADSTGITEAAKMLEGLAIVVATIELFRRRPALATALPAALAVSAAGAALTSALLWFGIAPEEILVRESLIGYRYAAHVGDINAAASHFVLVLCLALGMSARDRGRRRVLWLVAAGACGFGLWITASRTAEAAAAIIVPMAIAWVATSEWTRARRWKLIGGLLAAILVILAFRVWRIESNPANIASGFRQQFVMSSLRIIGTHPWFGIGAGQYYLDAPLFLTPQLAWTYGSENAHNNFLQITTEAGLVGFALFAAWFTGGLQLAGRALVRSPRDWRLLGVAAGTAAFLGTCVTGHPLVLSEVALAFSVQFALMACLGASKLLDHRIEEPGAQPPQRATPLARRALWPGAWIIGTLMLGVLPALTVVKPNAPVHLEEVDGFYYELESDAEGVPFRWTREYASVFVPATASRVEISLRAPVGTAADQPVPIEITAGGLTYAPVSVADRWKTVVIDLHPPPPPLAFNRINFKVNRVSFDKGRRVGIRVGDIRIARIAWQVMPSAPGARPQ